MRRRGSIIVPTPAFSGGHHSRVRRGGVPLLTATTVCPRAPALGLRRDPSRSELVKGNRCGGNQRASASAARTWSPPAREGRVGPSSIQSRPQGRRPLPFDTAVRSAISRSLASILQLNQGPRGQDAWPTHDGPTEAVRSLRSTSQRLPLSTARLASGAATSRSTARRSMRFRARTSLFSSDRARGCSACGLRSRTTWPLISTDWPALPGLRSHDGASSDPVAKVYTPLSKSQADTLRGEATPTPHSLKRRSPRPAERSNVSTRA